MKYFEKGSLMHATISHAASWVVAAPSPPPPPILGGPPPPPPHGGGGGHSSPCWQHLWETLDKKNMVDVNTLQATLNIYTFITLLYVLFFEIQASESLNCMLCHIWNPQEMNFKGTNSEI